MVELIFGTPFGIFSRGLAGAGLLGYGSCDDLGSALVGYQSHVPLELQGDDDDTLTLYG